MCVSLNLKIQIGKTVTKILRYSVIYIVHEIAIGLLHLDSRIYDHNRSRKNWLQKLAQVACCTYYKSFRTKYVVETSKT